MRDYLFSREDLNLTRSDSATVASNILYMMELLPPPKAAAVAYLDSGGAAPLPPRQARRCTFLTVQTKGSDLSLAAHYILPMLLLIGLQVTSACPKH